MAIKIPEKSFHRIDQYIIYKMEQVIKRYRQVASEALKAENAGLSVDQWIVLKQVREKSGTSQVDIARSTIKDAPTTTRILDQLLKKNLIIKQLDPEDRRQYMVFITEKGIQLIKRLLPIVMRYRTKSLENIEDEEMEFMQRILSKILANLK